MGYVVVFCRSVCVHAMHRRTRLVEVLGQRHIGRDQIGEGRVRSARVRSPLAHRHLGAHLKSHRQYSLHHGYDSDYYSIKRTSRRKCLFYNYEMSASVFFFS